MRIHAPLLPLAVCMMVGIGLSQYTNDWLMPLVGLVAVTLVTCFLGRFPRLQTAGIFIGTLLLGMVLGSRKQQQLNMEWPPQKMDVALVVMSEAKVGEKTVSFDAVTADDQQKLRCYIRRDKNSERIEVGQGLRVYTLINKVRERKQGTFDNKQYMQCHGFTGELYAYSNQWQWEAVSLKELSVTDRLRLRFLTWRVKDSFSRVGASHILALSGLHLMIIYSVITLVIGWHRYRIVTQATLVLAIWAFALLTGLSTSVVRSAFMISIYALLSLGYRERMSVNTLAFVAIVLLVVNPLAMYDLGFQLSFLSVLGILLIHPLINNLLKADVQQQHRWLSSIWGLVTVSIAAQMSTAPLVAYHFGRFSCWFLLSNFIVVPMAWLVLNVALLCIVFSWWSWAFSALTSILAWLATAMNHALGWVAQLPCSSIEGINLSALQVYLIYIIIACSYVAISLRYPAARRSG